METLAERLNECLRETGLNASELARRVEVTRSAMSLFLAGKRMPGRLALARMADELGTSVDYLLGRSEESGETTSLQDPVLGQLVEDFKKLNDRDQQRVLDLIHTLLGSGQKQNH